MKSLSYAILLAITAALLGVCVALGFSLKRDVDAGIEAARLRGEAAISVQKQVEKRDGEVKSRQLQILVKLDAIQKWQDDELKQRTANRYTSFDAARDFAAMRQELHLPRQPPMRRIIHLLACLLLHPDSW